MPETRAWRKKVWRIVFLGIFILDVNPIFAQQILEVVEVFGQTPLGAGIGVNKIPSNVQSATGDDLAAQRALDLADFMQRNLASVFVNDAQSNPLQPDLQYRGFVGSPLLGLPQGIAVYQDGVRLNEPFGDTVNWALIPDGSIETMYLMPGSNPLFGLNALGGAIAIRTKNGFTSAGSRAEAYAGAFNRLGVSVETGGQRSESFGYFFAGSYFEEDGWRDFSPSEAMQLFGKASWQSDAGSIDLGLSVADTALIGNGPAPIQSLEQSRRAIFTRPDASDNRLGLVNLIAERTVSDRLTLAGNAYFRGSDLDSTNGDDSDFEACAAFPGLICEVDDDVESLALDADGNPIAATVAVDGATVNRTQTRQNASGFGVQATWDGVAGGHENFFVVGMSYDDGDIEFRSSSELGALDTTRFAVPSGFLVADSFVDLKATTSNLGLYLTDTYSLSAAVTLNLSGRFNNTTVSLRDQIGTALSGDHEFSRFNPAVGIVAAIGKARFYANYSEANRAPSPVELTCADEEDPCRLPNAFLADPPLEQVVAKTVEFGFRGDWGAGTWHAGAFRTTNEDDIIFVSAGALTNQGFFDNVGKTRRQGIETDAAGRLGDRLDWFANFTLLDATFLQSLTFQSINNPAAVAGEVGVDAGDRLPLVPGRLFKAGMNHSVNDRLTWGLDVQSGSGFPMRGDEGNDAEAIGDYTVVNLRADYRLSDTLAVFLNVNNLLDRDYETFGLFGDAADVLGEEFDDSRFLSPAPPRAAWIGVRAEF